MSQVSVGRLTSAQMAKAVATLTRAFSEDPFFTHVFPDAEARDPAVRWYFEATTRACIALNGAYGTLDDPIGVALWVPTGGVIDPAIERSSGLDQRTAVFGPEADARYRILGRHFTELHRRIAPTPHRYLTLLGVDPDHQGRGVGGAVLAPGLAEADREGLMCYTETTRPRNAPFYERHGFVVVETGSIAEVPFWTFRREPASPRTADSRTMTQDGRH